MLPSHVSYLKHYSSHLTQLVEPLKELLRNDTLWCWKTKHQNAFEAIKDVLTKTAMLAYFDPKAHHIIHVDGSMMGFNAVLHQEGRPVVYAFRKLTQQRQVFQH